MGELLGETIATSIKKKKNFESFEFISKVPIPNMIHRWKKEKFISNEIESQFYV
jgi:hypothetical protein